MNLAQSRLFADALPHIVWSMQADGSCSYFNQKWFDYTGLSVAQSLGTGWAHLIHPDDRLRASRMWVQPLPAQEAFEAEYRLRRADGAYRWMLCRAVPQSDAATGPDGTPGPEWLGTFTDIDDLKQVTETLENKLYINRVAGKVARLGGWVIELADRKLTWSDENCLIHEVPPGYTPTLDEGISYFPPEHRATVIRHVQACAEHGIPYEFVLPKFTAKGRLIWVRSIGEAVRDEDGKIVRLQGAFQDITEQKEAEQRVRALETQLLNTFESITDGFYVVDADWTFTFMNSQAERMLRRTRQDLLGKNMWEEFPEALGTIAETQYRRALAEKRTARFELFFAPLETWFDVHAYPTESGLAMYLHDVTQTRLDQAQLRLLETAVSRLNDSVVIMEAQVPDDSGPRIVFVNDAFERQTGYTREEALGNTLDILWGPETHGAELERVRAAMAGWRAVRAEIAIHTRSGRQLCLEVDIAPIADESGRFTHWVAVERDVTERRQQQEEILKLNSDLESRVLQRTAQLATVNNELESFAYSVSHDLRGPLNTIDGFSRLLEKVDGPNAVEKSRHYLNRIHAGVRQMGDLIEGLLSLAHMSREQLRHERVDLSRIARVITKNWPERQSEFHIQDGLTAHGDPRLLLAVLQNLLVNAWKFSSRTPQPRIEVGSAPGEGGELVFFVRDNGVGFDMAFSARLFRTFERLHSPGDFPGTGIGLATVKRIIERHGGRVWAEGKLNHGATFYFTLGAPAELAAAGAPATGNRHLSP